MSGAAEVLAMVAAPISQAEADDLRRRMHAGKVQYTSHHAAHRASERLREQGESVGAYRCLFRALPSDPPHYHVGHVPSFERLERIALYLRFGVQTN